MSECFRTVQAPSRCCVRLIPNGGAELLIPACAGEVLVLAGAQSRLCRVNLQPGLLYFGIRFSPGTVCWNRTLPPAGLFDQVLRFSFPGEYSPIIPENLARFETLEKRRLIFWTVYSHVWRGQLRRRPSA